MAAVSDRLSRAIQFNALKPFDRRRFADLVAARCCAAAHFVPLHRINHALTQVLRNRALPSPAGLRSANRLNQSRRFGNLEGSVRSRGSDRGEEQWGDLIEAELNEAKPCRVRTTGDDNPSAVSTKETGAQTAPPCVRARDHSAAWRRYALIISLISARQEPQFVPACRACPIASTVTQPALAAAAI